MSEYRFTREARTPHSEVYTIDDGEHALGRIDLHFTASATYATLAIHHSLTEDQLHLLLEAIDDELVVTADPYREDLVVTVWRGEELGVFADDSGFGEDDDMDDDLDADDLDDSEPGDDGLDDGDVDEEED